MRIRDPESCLPRIRDPEWEKFGSGTNIPDPLHCLRYCVPGPDPCIDLACLMAVTLKLEKLLCLLYSGPDPQLFKGAVPPRYVLEPVN